MAETALILLVDDNEASRFAKAAALRRSGYTVIEAATGADALRIAAEQPIDVVLLDVNLPDISGLDVCARIKGDPRLAPVQVLQTSATAVTDRDKVRGLTGGADAYLVEGDHDVLLATLSALVRVRRAEQERAAALASEQEARRAAEDANRAKDDFLATLSHELRTPLNAMIGWLTLLKGGHLDAERQARALDAIERSARQQWTLVNELLDAASIRQRKMRLQMAPLDLEQVGAAAVELVRPEAERKQIDLAVFTQPTPVTGDPARLQQVITNLLNNAVQFTPERGQVALRIEPEGVTATIVVEDSGIGIEPRLLPHIFEQFRQGDSDRGGLGLGLAIAHHIVELHGGQIAAHSAGPGRGARFTVRIPAAA